MKMKSWLLKSIFLISLIPLTNESFNSCFFKNYNMDDHLEFNPKLNSSKSNNWSRIWDFYQSNGEQIITDNSSNVYIAGRTFNVSMSKSKIINVKYNKFGSEQWNDCWMFNGECSVKEFAIDSESNIYNLVSINAFPDDKNVLMKINSSGFSEWNKTFEGSIKCVHIDKHDNIFVSGYIWDWTNDIEYIFLKKFDQNGISQWNSTFRNEDYFSLIAYPLAIMIDHANQTCVAGLINTYGFPGETDYLSFGSYIPSPYVYVTIYDSSGVLTSLHKWRILDYYITSDIIFDPSLNFYLMGVDRSLTRNILLKYDFFGNLLFSSDWQKNGIEETFEFWQHIAQDKLNSTYCAGVNYWDRRNNHEIYLVKFDNQGNLEWDGACNIQNTYCDDLCIDSNFSLYLTGSSNSKMLILKNPSLVDINETEDQPITATPGFNLCFFLITISISIFFLAKEIFKKTKRKIETKK